VCPSGSTAITRSELKEDVIRQIADDRGPDSAFAKIIFDLDRRRAKGQDVILLTALEQMMVAPRDAFDGNTLHLEGDHTPRGRMRFVDDPKASQHVKAFLAAAEIGAVE
jgi:hypothetical protein